MLSFEWHRLFHGDFRLFLSWRGAVPLNTFVNIFFFPKTCEWLKRGLKIAQMSRIRFQTCSNAFEHFFPFVMFEKSLAQRTWMFQSFSVCTFTLLFSICQSSLLLFCQSNLSYLFSICLSSLLFLFCQSNLSYLFSILIFILLLFLFQSILFLSICQFV